MPPSRKIVNHLKPAEETLLGLLDHFLRSTPATGSSRLTLTSQTLETRLAFVYKCLGFAFFSPPSVFFFTVVFFYQTLAEKFSLLTHLPSLHFMLFNYFKLIFGVGLTIPLLLS